MGEGGGSKSESKESDKEGREGSKQAHTHCDIKELEVPSEILDGNEAQGVSNGCAICLEEFEEGVSVAHSVATSECPHIFHETCLKEVITAASMQGKYSIPCPCCRQTFVETEPHIPPEAQSQNNV